MMAVIPPEDSPARELEIPTQVDFISAQIGTLMAHVEMLNKRLSACLTAEEVDVEIAVQDSDLDTQLGKTLQELGHDIRISNTKLHTILNRLEL